MIFRNKTGFVSDIDKVLNEYEATHAKSASQLAEIKKYQRIYDLRDKPAEDQGKSSIWEEF